MKIFIFYTPGSGLTKLAYTDFFYALYRPDVGYVLCNVGALCRLFQEYQGY